MLHRAIVGSLERFIGILVEHYAGALPAWLAPQQVAVASITENQADYARKISEDLQKQGFRVIADLRNDKIGYKIRSLALQKLPYICVVGDKERQAGTVAVRARGGGDLGAMPMSDFADRLRLEVDQRGNGMAVPGA